MATHTPSNATPTFTTENRVGCLVEARVFALRTVETADEYSRTLGSVIAKVPAESRPVLCADHRPVRIYPQPVTDRLSDLFHAMNSRLERVAIMVARSNATLAMQLQRIVRDAGYDRRRVCFEPHEALEHLAPALSKNELARLEAFLTSWKGE